MRPPERPSPDPLTLLRSGAIEMKGRLPWSSNATFLVDVCLDDTSGLAVYKPLRGERPLWDYPEGLYRREVATYLVSEALGWGLVPETVIREDGPLGPGSLQRFVDADFGEHYFTLLERPEHHDALKAVCTFDLVVNNGDRKSGHCLLGRGGRLWAIDHGLCLHVDPKLRTVIWDFAGQPVPEARLEALGRLASSPPTALAGLVHEAEVEALAARCAVVLRRPVFPPVRSPRAYPWPLV
ncbi:MAG TPA: SCO1664 family protein [Acidimicrobiales bacterium]|nr:SCO1664 family protein [Acidimicrobiales bacterium]